MKKVLLIILAILFFCSCEGRIDSQNNIKPSPTVLEVFDSEVVGYKELCREVETEIEMDVEHDAFQSENYEKNVKYLMKTYNNRNYKSLPLDIMDVLEYVYFVKEKSSQEFEAQVLNYCYSFESDELLFSKASGRNEERWDPDLKMRSKPTH